MKSKFTILASLIVLLAASCSESIDQPVGASTESAAEPKTVLTKSIASRMSTGVTQEDVEDYLKYRLKANTSEIARIIRYDPNASQHVFVVFLNDGRWYVFSGSYDSIPVLASGDEENPCPLDNLDVFCEGQPKGRQNFGEETAEASRLVWQHVHRAASSHREGPTRDGDDPSELIYDYDLDTLSSVVYPALTQTQWHGGLPWNSAVPKLRYGSSRCYAGSDVVAIAQLLYYTHYTYGKPTSFREDASCTDYYDQHPYNYDFLDTTSIAWDYMPTASGSTTGNSYISDLYAHVALFTVTEYKVTSSTTTNPADSYTETNRLTMAQALTAFGLSVQSMGGADFSEASAKTEIQNGRPALCYQFNSLTDKVYRTYMFDGYRQYYIKETETISDPAGNVLEVNESYFSILNWHVNESLGNTSLYYWIASPDYYHDPDKIIKWY